MPEKLTPMHLRLYASTVDLCGKITLGVDHLKAVFRMADDEIAFRDVLKQIATSGGSNRDLVRMAVNALRERPVPSPANPRNQFPLMPPIGRDRAMPTTYRVTWEIDVDAFSPIDAAKLAKHYQTKRDTTANVFEVTDGNETVIVDLDEVRNPPERPYGDASRPALLVAKGL